ncbi:MAG: aminotransferase class III-fold pyridoxal phosphate-dependent enzyme [Proteobacteria bacterium]|nr:aminotransferase class III-fold pyridoxal phosphate-dependent enzyme [Pseudomonadota bacterium]
MKNTSVLVFLEYSLRQLFRPFTCYVIRDEKCIRINLSGLKGFPLKQGKKSSIEFLTTQLKKISAVKIEEGTLVVASNFKNKDLSLFLNTLQQSLESIARDNLWSEKIWADYINIQPTGFDEKAQGENKAELDKLYADQYIVSEKKSFIVDLAKSSGPYLLSSESERHSFLDGASQIATLALGYNDPRKKSLFLRPEILDADFDLKNSDIYQAFEYMLKSQSGMEHVYVVNSGAEAMECALRACQKRHPDRQKILAFEASFHGRTLLSLHCTHSPSKRLPFEIFPGLVDFLPYPEYKTPHLKEEIPSNWLKLWSSKNDLEFKKQLELIPLHRDAVLAKEIECLLSIRESLKKEKYLAFLAEPMLCEGGDCYATPRFYQALRLLTRAYDVPLVIDEVQTGFGLGGPFFWFKLFDFKTAEGKEDFPDVLCCAKKAQVAACISQIEQDHIMETSAVSMYRGYIQGQEVLRNPPYDVAEMSRKYLNLLQEHVGSEILSFPRAMGAAFSFDLPTAEILNALVAKRFQHGILFYPAGDKTARFRMLLQAPEEQYVQLFSALRRSFLELSNEGKVAAGKSWEAWIEALGDKKKFIDRKFSSEVHFVWDDYGIPRVQSDFSKTSAFQWNEIFSGLIKNAPFLLYSCWNHHWNLENLAKASVESLWNFYQENPSFTYLDLLWQSSRAFGYKLQHLKPKDIDLYAQQIEALEKRVYEPARQEDVKKLREYSSNSKTIFLACIDSDKILGMSVSCALEKFKNVGLVDKDPLAKKSGSLYGVDLTVDPSQQGKGLGLRLKAEQIMEAYNRGVHTIRSRNRFPEAGAMMKLNQQLGAVVIADLNNAYGPGTLTKYQSISFYPKKTTLGIADPRWPSVMNKGSLANFVSKDLVDNLLLLKEFLPKDMRHIYLASSRGEALDKVVKLLRAKRSQAWMALSSEGDYFGRTTAASRSLGSKGGSCFFDWPTFPDNINKQDLEEFLWSLPEEEVLGVFLEPRSEIKKKNKSSAYLKMIEKVVHERKLPLIFNETASAFGAFDKKKFMVAEDFNADISYFYAAPQLAVIACKKEFFNDKPLMMISTWDGDEFGLHSFKNRLGKFVETL